MKYLDAKAAKHTKALGGDAAAQSKSAGAKMDRRGIEDKMLRGPVADKTDTPQPKEPKGRKAKAKKEEESSDTTLDVQDQFISLAEPDDEEQSGEEWPE